MKVYFSIKKDRVHLWHIVLTDFCQEEQQLCHILSMDELERAYRFRFSMHKQRFIITRAYLRKILSLYIKVPPEKILFTYNSHGKPYLKKNTIGLSFNLSHSHDMAVYAFTFNREVGADIEYIEPPYKENIVQRFFSSQEQIYLTHAPIEQRIIAFYHIWAKKEALIKCLGTGFYTSIETISIDPNKLHENVLLIHENTPHYFNVQKIEIDSRYATALATSRPIKAIELFQWSKAGVIKI